ncbi:MAG: glycoside hydrolase family 88 protein, partial [Spirochaetales bacterium]|nr:glycoside hydrolase family 88 protein [Candidatus Physcosoma equi]
MLKDYATWFLSQRLPVFLSDKAWNYKNDISVLAAYYLYKTTGEELYKDAVLASSKYLLKDDGTVINWSADNIDKISFGKSLRALYDLTGDEKYRTAYLKIYENFKTYPRTVTGNFWHKDIYPNQVWLDGLYMGQPFYAAVSEEIGEDQLDDILGQIKKAEEMLYNPELGLYMHAVDCSKEAEWANKTNGQSPAVWLRAEGWYLMALCDVYEILCDKTPRAKELVPLLKKALDGIMPYQVEETKMFLQVVDRKDLAGNYSETSGSAMVAYAFMKGARLGMLEKAEAAKGREILEGIVRTYIKRDENGVH